MRIVPAFDELKHGWTGFGWEVEGGAVQQFIFEGREEAFAEGIVPSTVLGVNSTIADRAQRGADARFTAAAAKGQGGVLATVIGMMYDILGTALLDGHWQDF